jgi:hypothetical protein
MRLVSNRACHVLLRASSSRGAVRFAQFLRLRFSMQVRAGVQCIHPQAPLQALWGDLLQVLYAPRRTRHMNSNRLLRAS